MHPISGSTSVNNHFVDGSSTQSGTVVTADWLNTVQDEICNVITSIGIPLNPSTEDDRKQLSVAIQKIISNSIINLVTQINFDALSSRVSTCEEEIKKIIGKTSLL